MGEQPEKSPRGGAAAAIILMVIGALNIAYGLYRLVGGGEFLAPAFGVGAAGLLFGVVLFQRARGAGQ